MSTAPKVIGYIRVSTDKQDIGPEVQRSALEAEASARGWDLEIRQENATSARSLANRPVLAEALADLRAGRAQVLAVSKLDRLSRSVADFAGILERAGKQGWALVAFDVNVDTTTPTGAAMAQVTVVFAELERKRIGERTREGMQKIKATTGKHMGRPSALPAATVAKIHELRSDGLSLAKIAARMNAEGAPTATGKSWHASTIRQVLGRPTAA